MSLKTEAIKRFLTAARSLANQGMSKEAIMQFAKNEFGEITELFQKQIDRIFKRPATGIENIKIKDKVFDDTVIKLPMDDTGQPFNPRDPLKQYGEPKKNRPDVYSLDDYDTTNMSDIKKQIIRTETKLGNLNPDSPDFKERAKVLIDEIEELKNKIPRTDKYTGGMVDVEPNLSDIGHGSDALMARTRLMSPGAQATTSTGLNYLLAEDNDNIRIPFAGGGSDRMMSDAEKEFDAYNKMRDEMDFKMFLEKRKKDMEKDKKRLLEKKYGVAVAEGGRIGFSKGKLADAARRKFMKAAGAGAAGLAALKTGLIGLAEKAGPQVEMIKETITGAPNYFFDLVSKIKLFGKESKVKPSERVNEYSYTGKNGDEYTMIEDITSGDIQITKDKMGGVMAGDEMVEGITDRSVMEYKSGKMGEEGISAKMPEEYDEYKIEFDVEGGMADADDISESIRKEIIEEASEKITKKADGGRIGYSKGKLVFENAAKFLEKIFGKEGMAEMPKRDPEMFQGLLEVVDMFRKRDKEGLIKYMRRFLPHLDDTEIEEFIIGDEGIGIDDIQGQLIRLGSGRDYKAKMNLLEEAERNRKLADLEVTEEMKRKPNASGGLANLLGE
tara:strand:- start:2294 stop:4129 length:1836 start_codon:yes stop_codon:yes gene_type:complete